MDDIRSLIRAYNAAAQDAVSELRREYPAFSDALSLRSAGIPREGTLASGRTFTFHGIGCDFEGSTISVDVDFGPGGRHDGFDAWRLSLFAQNIRAGFTYELIQDALNSMLKAGEIVKSPQDQLGSHLYYWQT